MTSKFATAAIAAASIAAAGIGGYVAVRSSATETPVSAVAQPGTLAPAAETAAPTASTARTAPGDRTLARANATSRGARSRPAERLPVQERQSATPALPATPAVSDSAMATVDDTETASVTDPALPATPAAIDLPAPVATFDDIEVPAEAVVGIRLDTAVSSERSRVEDRVTGRVTRDVKVDDRTVIPAGATIEGYVSVVEPGGKVRERARIGIRFTSLTIDRVRLPIETETIFRDGEAPGGEATAKIGASAVIGTILGGAFGGKKGAAIGGAAGAAGGTAVVMAGGRNPATIAAGTPLTVRLSAPVVVRIER